MDHTRPDTQTLGKGKEKEKIESGEATLSLTHTLSRSLLPSPFFPSSLPPFSLFLPSSISSRVLLCVFLSILTSPSLAFPFHSFPLPPSLSIYIYIQIPTPFSIFFSLSLPHSHFLYNRFIFFYMYCVPSPMYSKRKTKQNKQIRNITIYIHLMWC